MTRRRLPRCVAAVGGVCLVVGTTAAGANRTDHASSHRRAAADSVAGRTIDFVTTEMTWTSVDVSPDGRTLVFDCLGQVYTVPIEGGYASRLTPALATSRAVETEPRVSPDGRWVTFVSDRDGEANVWVARIDGSEPRALTHYHDDAFVSSPAWTPDGHAVLASVERYPWDTAGGPTAGIAVAPLTGDTVRILTNTGTRPHGAAFGRNLRTLYLSVGGDAWKWGRGRQHVARYDLGTGQLAPLIDGGPGGAFRPLVSPDDHWLVYATRPDTATELRLRDLTNGADRSLGTTDRVLVDASQPDEQNLYYAFAGLPGSAFTPDSKALVTSFGGHVWRVDVPSGARRIIPITVPVRRQLPPLAQFTYPFNDSTVTVRQIRDPRVSPDGQAVAFSALDRIWVMPLTGGSPRRLTADSIGEFSPAWSPDGRTIAYSTWDAAGGYIYRTGADGTGRPERLSPAPAFYDKLRYTPDGSRIVALRAPAAWWAAQDGTSLQYEPDSAGQLIAIPSAGGSASVVASGRAPLGSGQGAVTFVGPSRELATYVHLGESSDANSLETEDGVVTVGPGSAPARTLIAVRSQVLYDRPDVVAVAPDGRRAAALINRQVYLLDLPPGGGPTPVVTIDHSVPRGVPISRVSGAGADFVDWAADGHTLYYALGASLFAYDVATRQTTETPVRITVPADRPAGVVALRGARVITMRGDEVIESGDVVIRGSRIAAVGRTGQVTIPRDAHVIDLHGKTVMPGWVDVHGHPTVPERIHPRVSGDLAANLAYGVTTVRDPNPNSSVWVTDVLSWADRSATGDALAPRLFSTGPAQYWQRIANAAEAETIARRNARYYRTETFKTYAHFRREIDTWFADAARQERLTPTVHIQMGDYRSTLAHILDGFAGHEHDLGTSPVFDDLAQLVTRSGTTYTPTLQIIGGECLALRAYNREDDPRVPRFLTRARRLNVARCDTVRGTGQSDDERVGLEFARGVARVHRAGARIGLGSHGQIQGLGAHLELWAYAAGGMPLHDVLHSATIVGAEAIGHAADLGSIEPGKLADLLVLDRNPLADIHNTLSLRYVMKNGRLFESATLDELWPERRLFSQIPAWHGE